MTDEQLVEILVVMGVVDLVGPTGYEPRVAVQYMTPGGDIWQSFEAVLQDWSVAGAMIEKCQKIYIEYIGEPEQAVYARAENSRTREWIHDKSVCRSIILAGVVAMQ